LDLGPSQVNVVCNEIAVKETFCAEIEDKSQEIRRLQRKLDRQHRSGSKGCFDSKGRHTQGGCDWKMRSHRSKQTQNQLADIWRRLAAQRESLHGNLANRVLAQGAVIKTEGISYGSWQKNFGKSVNRRAPGSFISTLARKAANAGGQLIEVNPWSTKLSQTCVCGRQEKKSLSQRTHVCPICHLTTDRDILSALLVRHVDCGATHTLDLVTTQNEMQHRHDIDGWSRFSVHNLRVPQAIKLRGQGENPWSGSAISSRITVDARGEAV
jgi:transposase